MAMQPASISTSIFLSDSGARSRCSCAFNKHQMQETNPRTSVLQLCTWDMHFRQRHTAATSKTTHMTPPTDAPTATPTGADVVSAGADVVAGAAEVVAAGADVVAGAAEVVAAGADVVAGAAEVASVKMSTAFKAALPAAQGMRLAHAIS